MESLEMRLTLSGSPIWVSNTDDSGDGSLRAAIEEANTNPGEDTIRFRRSAWGTIALSSQLNITDDLVIDGPGAPKVTVSGQGASRVFLVLPEALDDNPFVTPTPAQLETSPEVTIRKLTVVDGFATDAPGNASPGPFAFGGGIYNLGGSVHLEKVDMTGNAIEGLLAAGGAVANEFGGKLTVSRSDFAENEANGVIVGVGGAITSDLGPTVDAFSIEGSGVAPEGFPLSGHPPRPHFIDNGSLTVGDTTLSYTGAGSVQTFSENLLTGTGTFGSADPFVFTDADGDVLVTYYGRTDITPSAAEEGTFALLPAGLHPDGLPFNPGDVYAYWIAEFVVQPESTGKYAGASGSWIMDAYSAPFSPTEIGPTGVGVPLDYRWESRGDVQLVFPTDQPEVHIERSSFELNTATSQLGHIPTEAFSGLAGGGAILNVTGLMSVDRSHFVDNSAHSGQGIGGAVRGGPAFGGAINSSNISPFGAAQSVLDVRRSTFINNSAHGGDGGATGSEGGEAGGGAIKITNGGQANLERNRFEGNTATGGDGIGDGDGGAATGGAVAASAGASMNLNRDRLTGNSADGGAAEDGDGGVGRGGGLGLFTVDLTGWIPGLSGNAEITKGNFKENTAVGGLGGGIFNDGDLTVVKSSFTGNEALGAADVILALNPAQASVGGAAGRRDRQLRRTKRVAQQLQGQSRPWRRRCGQRRQLLPAWRCGFSGRGIWRRDHQQRRFCPSDRSKRASFATTLPKRVTAARASLPRLALRGGVLSDSELTVIGSSFRRQLRHWRRRFDQPVPQWPRPWRRHRQRLAAARGAAQPIRAVR